MVGTEPALLSSGGDDKILAYVRSPIPSTSAYPISSAILSLTPQAEGYSTVGEWKPLGIMKRLEKERGNPWTVPTTLNPKTHEAIWVTHKPEDAIIYRHSSELRDIPKDMKVSPRDAIYDEWVAYNKELKNPLSHVVVVDLTGATPYMDDDDGGYLYVRPIASTLANILASELDESKPLYHVTDAKHLPSILKKGLVPQVGPTTDAPQDPRWYSY
jgi:hypothetical protein